MAQPDPFDPTRALDGWRVPAPRAVDPVLELAALLSAPQTGGDEAGILLTRPWPQAAGNDLAHALDGWCPPVAAPLDLELRSLRRAGGSSKPGDAKKAWLKAHGYEMRDIEDVEVSEPGRAARPESAMPPEVPVDRGPVEAALSPRSPAPLAGERRPEAPAAADDVPASPAAPAAPPREAPAASAQQPDDPPPPLADVRLPDIALPAVEVEAPALDFRAPAMPPPAPQAVIAELQLPRVEPPAPVVAPVLEIRRPAGPARQDPRLLTGWQPRAWTALARRVRSGATELVQAPAGPRVVTHGPQWLCALWRPQGAEAPLLGRWPELACLVTAETVFGALQQLLDELPPKARVWVAELDADWALIAELVLRQDAGLGALQSRALGELIESERQAGLARLSQRYAASSGIVRRCA